jgi:hypothetical protein
MFFFYSTLVLVAEKIRPIQAWKITLLLLKRAWKPTLVIGIICFILSLPDILFSSIVDPLFYIRGEGFWTMFKTLFPPSAFFTSTIISAILLMISSVIPTIYYFRNMRSCIQTELDRITYEKKSIYWKLDKKY